MSINFEPSGHIAPEEHHYYRQDSIPSLSDPLQVGDLWSDTTGNLLKRCTSTSPITFVSVEGGSSAHDLFSATHGDVDEADTPADTEVLTFDSASGKWKAAAAGGHAEAHTLASHTTEAHSELTGVGAADHQAEVSLAGAPNYLTIAGQVITRALINLASHVTGTLPIANGGTNLAANPQVEAVISAASLKGTTTAGAGDTDKLPESAETTTNKVNYDYMAFDTTTEENAFFQYSIPKGWDEGTITFRFKWTNTAGLTTETVVMGLKAVALSNDEALDTAWGTEVTVTDTWLAQDDLHISPESAALTIGGTPAEGDMVLFNLAGKTGSDNLTGDTRVLEVIVTFTRDSYTD